MFKRQYKSSVEIEAPCSLIWNTLVANTDYHQWNTFTTKVELTSWEIGTAVKMEVQMKLGAPPISQTEYLTQYEEGRIIAWGMKSGLFLKAERVQSLTDHGDHCTYESVDIIEGALTPIVHFLYGCHIQAGFDRLCSGLKEYAESATS